MIKKYIPLIIMISAFGGATANSSNIISENDLPVFKTNFAVPLRFELEGGVFTFCIENHPVDEKLEFIRLDNIGKMTSVWSMSHRMFLMKKENELSEDQPLQDEEGGLKRRKIETNPIVPSKYLYKDFSHTQHFSMPDSRVDIKWSFSSASKTGLTGLGIFSSSDDFFVYVQNSFAEKIKLIADSFQKIKDDEATGKLFV